MLYLRRENDGANDVSGLATYSRGQGAIKKLTQLSQNLLGRGIRRDTRTLPGARENLTCRPHLTAPNWLTQAGRIGQMRAHKNLGQTKNRALNRGLGGFVTSAWDDLSDSGESRVEYGGPSRSASAPRLSSGKGVRTKAFPRVQHHKRGGERWL